MSLASNMYPLSTKDYKDRLKLLIESGKCGVRFSEKTALILEKGLKSSLDLSVEIKEFLR